MSSNSVFGYLNYVDILPLKRISQLCETIGSSFIHLLLKNQPGKWHSKPLHKSFTQQATGVSFLKQKPMTCPRSLILYENLSMPLLFHSPWLTSLLMHMHESMHLSANLLQKPHRRYRAPCPLLFSVPGGGFSHFLNIISLHQPQRFQELEGSGSFSSFSEEKLRPHSRFLNTRW